MQQQMTKHCTLLVVTLALVFSLVCFSANSTTIPDKYDWQFKRAVTDYSPFMEYRWLKAQCYQESRLEWDAESPVGALGLCQIMPVTWKEITKSLNWPQWVSPLFPSLSIKAAAYYDAKLYSKWTTQRPYLDKLNLMFASYNAGFGNILEAQKKCNNAVLYSEIIQCLELVTGHYSKETITYVERINNYYKMLLVF